jgi:glycosyltransferase involved in cell wall biosynthesis
MSPLRATRSALRIVSVCRTLPTPADPTAGTFVAARLAALARVADAHVLQPVPFCPVLRPLPSWARAAHTVGLLPIEPVPMFYLPGVMKSLDGMWLGRSIRGRVAALHRQQPLDALDAHFGYPDGVGCLQVARALGLPVFITIRGFETDFLRRAGVGEQLRAALTTATGCISVSHSLRQLAIEHGVDPGRIRVIPNAVDRELFHPGERAAARRALGLDAQAPLVVSVGHLISGKRHDVLVRALVGLRRRYPRVRLAVIGGPAYEPDYPHKLAQLVRELGLGEQVQMSGRLAQPLVNTWLQAADVFALASYREGCCNAVLEALAAGRPVVVTPVGDNPQFVREGVNGLLAPVDDVAAFEHALAAALARQWDAQAISRSLEVGGWSEIARRVLEFFRERLAAESQAAAHGLAHG